MTTSNNRVLHTKAGAAQRAAVGVSEPLIVSEVPAGAEAMIGKPLLGLTLTIDGDYVCLIPISGLASSLSVRVKPQLTAMTLSSSGPDELVDFDPRTTDVASALVAASGTGDGALSDDVMQTAILTVTGGNYARYTLTAGSTPTSITFDVADYTGL
jgi:hypothetical protein